MSTDILQNAADNCANRVYFCTGIPLLYFYIISGTKNEFVSCLKINSLETFVKKSLSAIEMRRQCIHLLLSLILCPRKTLRNFIAIISIAKEEDAI